MKKLIFIKMIRYWLVFTVFFFSVSVCFSINAVEVKDLYVAKVPIATQGKNDRNRALKEALRSVLVKVGGHRSILKHQAIRPQINQFNRFVTNYRYVYQDNQQLLRASFDQSKVNQLFVDANLPLWGSLRPQVVLWLVDENGLSRDVISETHLSQLVQTVSTFTQERGLPIAMPLWDLSDTTKLSTSDIWGRFSQPVYYASKRYLAEAIIIVRISDNSLLSEEQRNSSVGCELLCQKAITLDWSNISATNIDESPTFSKRYKGFDRHLLLRQALSDITDNIYQGYALTTDENNQYDIDVANVETLSSYVEISVFLQQLSSVQSVKLISAHGQKRRFRLKLLGSKKALLASLKLNNALKQHIDVLNPAFNEKTPVFYWGKF
jgi:hypothetical protein